MRRGRKVDEARLGATLTAMTMSERANVFYEMTQHEFCFFAVL